MYEFQICISRLGHFIDLHATVSKYLTWIFNKNLKTNVSKTEFLIFSLKTCSTQHFPFLYMKLLPNYWSPRYRCCSHSAFSFVSPPTHSVHQQLILALPLKYYPYPFTVFHVHYNHLYPSTMIPCFFYCSSRNGLPAFILNLLQPIPNIYLKYKPNNVTALLSHHREKKNPNSSNLPTRPYII